MPLLNEEEMKEMEGEKTALRLCVKAMDEHIIQLQQRLCQTEPVAEKLLAAKHELDGAIGMRGSFRKRFKLT